MSVPNEVRQVLRDSLDDYKKDHRLVDAERKAAQLTLMVSALRAQLEERSLASKQANEVTLNLMNQRLTPSELGELVFKRLQEHMGQKELSRSQNYAGVIQNTIVALDHAIQTTGDAATKQRLVDIVQALHITVQV